MAEKIKNKPTKPSQEIAIERNLTEIERIDTLLDAALNGDINEYRNLLIDTTVSGTWGQRQTALTRLERQVIPHDPDNPADVEAAEFIDAQLNRINFDRVLKAMHWGIYYGYGVAEAMFGIDGNKVVLNDLIVRDRGKFKFNAKHELVFIGNNTETVMPANKFWTFSAAGDTTDNPYGIGLAHFLYWPVLFKKSNIKFWLIGNEKMATSVPHVQYDSAAKDPDSERQKALQAAIAIKNGSAIATAKGVLVELLKGASGAADYETLCRYMDEATAVIVLGQVMTSQAVGGQYKAEVQNEVKEDIVKSDADLLCDSLNNSVVKWLTEWNFPGANPPKVWLLTQDEIDQQAITAAFANMARLGYRPTIGYVKETLGGDWEPIPQAALPAPEDAPPADFAEGDLEPETPPDSMSERLARELAPHNDQWIARIADDLAKSETLLEFRERLDSLAGELSIDDYAEIFARASTAAYLAGRAEASDEGRA